MNIIIALNAINDSYSQIAGIAQVYPYTVVEAVYFFNFQSCLWIQMQASLSLTILAKLYLFICFLLLNTTSIFLL